MWFSFELFCLLWSWIFFMYFWAFWFLFFEIDYLCLFFWFSNESHSFSSWFVRGLNLMWIIAWNQLYVANILLYLCFIFLIYLLFSIAFWWTMEKAMAPHSSTLAWKIPWMEEPGRLQYMGSQRVGHDWATSLSLFTFTHWRKKWQPTPVFLPGESQGWESLVGCSLWGRTEPDTTEVT